MTDIERKDGNSFHDIEISHALKGLAEIRALSEEKHTEQPTASKLLSRELSDELKQAHEDTVTHQEPTFAQRNRIITRRQSRRVVQALTNRHR
jgi:hypothetical protein